MKRSILSLCLCTFISQTLGLVLPEERASDDGFAHYATYTFTDSDESMHFYVISDMHNGEAPLSIQLNSTDAPGFLANSTNTKSPGFTRRTTSTGLDGLEDRDLGDICDLLYGCMMDMAAADKTTAAIALANISARKCLSVAQTVWTYFSADGYAHAKELAAYTTNNVVLPWAVGIASTAFTNVYLNGESGSEDPFTATASNDLCTIEDYQALAETHASAVYDFCLYIANTNSLSNNPTHYTSGQVLKDESEIDGAVTLARMNVAATKGKMQAKCSSLGITWRRWIPSMAWKTLGM